MPKKLNAKQQAVAKVLGRKRVSEYKDLVDNTVPCIYAAMGLALYEKGWRYKRINNLFQRSQEIWNEYADQQGWMTEHFEEVTGIEITSRKDVF